ncbi:MAG: FAD:protein FMN transferase [Verrucomicrobia bacterium]|nr:FAD:protein FMN transferase [Verrucomicrobiota bacterium]
MRFVKNSSFRLLLVLMVMTLIFIVRSHQSVSNPSWEQPTMGTLCHITLSGSIPKSELAALRKKIDAALVNVNRRMSTWQADTEISKFNAFQSLEPFPVSPEFATVVRRALELSAATDGAFDPTVKKLVDHWGFGPESDGDSVEEILKAVGWRKVSLRGDALLKSHPGVQLDLSAIAKGYGADAVADVIRRRGRMSFIVEIGGEIVADGWKPNGQAWRVGIETPDPAQPFGADILESVMLSGRALATSGDYRNFRVREDGTRFSHIIDPHTGMPAATDVASVSVLAGSCMDADAIATALFVMGSEKSFQWLETHSEIEAFFTLHMPDQTLSTRATDGFPLNEREN